MQNIKNLVIIEQFTKLQDFYLSHHSGAGGKHD